LSQKDQASTPKRAAAPVEEAEETELIEVSTNPSRRRRGLGKTSVASVLAGVVAAGALFGWAWVARSAGEDSVSNSLATDAAVPEAAAAAAEHGFSDRSQDASRSAARSGLNSAVAGENAKQRDAALNSEYSDTLENIANETAAQRDALMEEDLKLVAAQAEKLEAEAKAAEERLAAAKKSLEQAGVDTSKIDPNDVSAASDGGGSMPVKSNYTVGAHFGQTGSWSRYHTGQDFPAPVGTPIYAAASGIVMSPTAASWAGNNVVIKHMNGGSTLYAHMSQSLVSPGQAVKAGQMIGYVGTTGRSFGAHLHFEYYPQGTTPGDVYKATDPMAFLRSLGVG
jgi:peptidase M23